MTLMLDRQFCLGTSSLVGQKLGPSAIKTTHSKKFVEWFGYSDVSDKVILMTEMLVALYFSGFILMLVTVSALKIGQKRLKSVTNISNLSPTRVTNIDKANDSIPKWIMWRISMWNRRKVGVRVWRLRLRLSIIDGQLNCWFGVITNCSLSSSIIKN